jgi:hypothetical protein
MSGPIPLRSAFSPVAQSEDLEACGVGGGTCTMPTWPEVEGELDLAAA